jgi:hypothetical protein
MEQRMLIPCETAVKILMKAVEEVRNELLAILLLPIHEVRRPFFNHLAKPNGVNFG